MKQGQLFLVAIMMGAALLLCYDGLRVFRRICFHGVLTIAIEDLLFWIFCALVLFGFMYRQNNGIIRGFLVFGAAVGMVLYSIFVSRYMVKTGTAALRWFIRKGKRIFGWIFRPFRAVGTCLGKRVKKSSVVWKKGFRGLKKRLKKLCKAVRIGLRKM